MSADKSTDNRHDEDLARDLLSILQDDAADPPQKLTDQTIRAVQAELTGRDLIDLTTFVFLMRFCAPLLDLIAAFFGQDPRVGNDRRPNDE